MFQSNKPTLLSCFFLLTLLPVISSSQSMQDMYVQKANEVKNMVTEGLDRAHAHIEDMQEIGGTVRKKAFEPIFDVVYKCKNANTGFETKNVDLITVQIEEIMTKYDDLINLEQNSVSRLVNILKSSKENACYSGYERNINSYVDCLMKMYHYSSALEQSLGISTMKIQFNTVKDQAKDYISCSKSKGALNFDDANIVADKLSKAGEFYSSTSRRFSATAEKISN